MASPSRAPNLTIERLPGENAVYFRLKGVINETFDPAKLVDIGECAIVDLGGVRSITSFGVRRWRDFVSAVPSTTSLYLLDCPPCVVDQINLVLNFVGRAEVLSARAPYFCPKCEKDAEVRFDLLNQPELVRGAQPGPQPCPTCGTEMEGESDYLRFAPRHAAKSLNKAAARLLGLLGVYSGHASEARSLEVQKLVEGSVTLIKISGSIDPKFRSKRLLEGVEGTVVVLLDAATVADDGIHAWNEFLSSLSAQASEAVLVDLAYAIVELNERGLVDFGRCIVHSVQLPFFCQNCLEIQSHSLPLEALDDGFTGDPCQRCGRDTAPIEGMISLDALRARAATTPPAALDALNRANELFSMAHVQAAVTADSDSLGGKTQIGGYRIIKPLSAGGMAQVFLASKSSLGGFEKPVALKLFRRSLIESSRSSLGMFLSEAKICARLSHPNIVQIFDVGEAGGDLYMAMEFIDGRDTGDILEKNGMPLPVPVVLLIAEKILEALDYAHNAKDLSGAPLKIVHRDVSLQNILINRDGWVKLIDFGIAVTGEQRLSSEVAGNVCYMSPEQCYGQPLDGRSDLFSLGVVLYEMLSGQYLFRRPTIEQTLTAMLHAPIRPLSEVPPELAQVVMKAIERDVANRWQSAKEMVDALRKAALICGPAIDAGGLAELVRRLFPPPAASKPSAPRATPFEDTMLQVEVRVKSDPDARPPPAPPKPDPVGDSGPSLPRADSGGALARADTPPATPPAKAPQPVRREVATPPVRSKPAATPAPAPPPTKRSSSQLIWIAAFVVAALLTSGAVAWIMLSP